MVARKNRNPPQWAGKSCYGSELTSTFGYRSGSNPRRFTSSTTKSVKIEDRLLSFVPDSKFFCVANIRKYWEIFLGTKIVVRSNSPYTRVLPFLDIVSSLVLKTF